MYLENLKSQSWLKLTHVRCMCCLSLPKDTSYFSHLWPTYRKFIPSSLCFSQVLRIFLQFTNICSYNFLLQGFKPSSCHSCIKSLPYLIIFVSLNYASCLYFLILSCLYSLMLLLRNFIIFTYITAEAWRKCRYGHSLEMKLCLNMGKVRLTH